MSRGRPLSLISHWRVRKWTWVTFPHPAPVLFMGVSPGVSGNPKQFWKAGFKRVEVNSNTLRRLRFEENFEHQKRFIFFMSLFSQYECAAIQQQVSKGSTISTIKYSLGRLMRTDANWLVCHNTQGRGGGGAENLNVCREKRILRTWSKYIVRLSQWQVAALFYEYAAELVVLLAHDDKILRYISAWSL